MDFHGRVLTAGAVLRNPEFKGIDFAHQGSRPLVEYQLKLPG